MMWIIGIVSYMTLVWLFTKFFGFVADTDQEIEEMMRARRGRNQ